jgi:hypothetical protein
MPNPFAKSKKAQKRQGPLQDTVHPRWKTYWPVFLLLFIALIVAPLAFIQASVTITGALQVGRVSFVSGSLRGGRLFNRIETSTLTLQEFDSLTLGQGRLEETSRLPQPPSPRATWRQRASGLITITPSDKASATVMLKDVTVNQLALPERAGLILSWSEAEPLHFLLQVDAASREAPVLGQLAFVNNPLLFFCRGCVFSGSVADPDGASSWRFHAEPGQELKFQGSPTGITLGFALNSNSMFKEEGIPVDRALDFTVTREGKRASTIMADGTITITDTKEEIRVKPGEFLLLDHLQDFHLNEVRVDKGIHLTFSGRVGEFRSGPLKLSQDHLPSYLEWLYHRQTWMLYLYAVGWVCVAALEIGRNMHEKKER